MEAKKKSGRPKNAAPTKPSYGFFGCGRTGCGVAGVVAGVFAGAAGVVAGAGFGAGFETRSRIELPCPTALSVRSTMAKAQSMNMTAHHVVALERTLAAPRGPKAVWLPAPPNAPARSAALPLWSRTTTINTRQLATKNAGNTQKSQRESASLHPAVIIPRPTNNAIAHFIQPGISKTSLKTKNGGINPLQARLRKIHERGERLGVETRSAHKRAIQFFLCHQPLNIVGLDAAAVENPQGGGMADGELLPRASPKNPMSCGGNFRGRRAARADGPNRFVRNQNTGELFGGQRAGPPVNWRLSTCSVRPASRSSCVSPRQTMGVRPLSSAIKVFLATLSSVSRKSWRRSEWPMMT